MINNPSIIIWDPIVRIFHWGLVITFSICYFTQEENYELHLDSGYILLSLVFIRIVWGFFGKKHARFSDFLYPPSETIQYLRDFTRLNNRRFLGHTPAGGLMIMMQILCMLVITISGIALDAAENRAGPLADTMLFTRHDQVNTIHTVSTDFSVVLIIIHILAITLTSIYHRENLVLSMITGRKRQ